MYLLNFMYVEWEDQEEVYEILQEIISVEPVQATLCCASLFGDSIPGSHLPDFGPPSGASLLLHILLRHRICVLALHQLLQPEEQVRYPFRHQSNRHPHRLQLSIRTVYLPHLLQKLHLDLEPGAPSLRKLHGLSVVL